MREKRTCSIVVWALSATVVTLSLTGIGEASSERILHSFIDLKRGANPHASLVANADGALYGTTPAGGIYGEGTVFKVIIDQNGKNVQTVLYSFGAKPNDGLQPQASLTIDAAGNLYGTTPYGGSGMYSYGTIFKLSPMVNGTWTESVLYSFTGLNGDGAAPVDKLIFDAAGNLYGTTGYGGANGAGMVFELKPSSDSNWTESILYSFTGGADGTQPDAGLILDKQGNLYGTAMFGGDLGCGGGDNPPGCGTVFKLTHQANDSWNQTVLFTFSGSSGFWSGPVGGVISDSAGNLYGMNGSSGEGFGNVFELISDHNGNFKERILYTLDRDDDGYPVGDLIFDSSGNLYGATYGAVFRLTHRSVGHWPVTLLHKFHGGNDGAYLAAGVIQDAIGNLYGTTTTGGDARNLGIVFELTPGPKGSWTETLLYRFPSTDGSNVYGGIVSDADGNFYGTTYDGGVHECYDGGCGIVFKLSQSADGEWERTVLYAFKGGRDGYNPMAGLIFDQAGNLYGTTTAGGTGQCSCGTIFELSPTQGEEWKERVLYSFQGSPDGWSPQSTLVFDGSGNLYGTTRSGGVCFESSCNGVVFKLSPRGNDRWTESVIYAFNGTPDGSVPYAGLIFDGAGNLYGTTQQGGSGTLGTVYQLSPRSDSWDEKVLHSFTGPDGRYPLAGLIFDREGKLYGTTPTGGTGYGCGPGCGTVFQLTNTGHRWAETVLHSFDITDGAFPEGGLVMDEAGSLYGTTTAGATNYGSVFKLSIEGQWHENLLHNFSGPPDGSKPMADLLFGHDGKLYGTTAMGGPGGYFYGGTVYSIEP
jgi:uncharacterized repeat protein (TIGR03803 family)